MKETCMQITSALLTGVVTWQVYYNYKANEEMGEKYMSLGHALYAWISLLPGVALGAFVTKLSFADKNQRGVLLQKRFLFDLCALLYSIIAFVLIAYNLFRKAYNVH